MSRLSPKSQPPSSDKKPARQIGGRAQKANPEEFGKKTTPVRERMAKAVKETPPDERIKQGR